MYSFKFFKCKFLGCQHKRKGQENQAEKKVINLHSVSSKTHDSSPNTSKTFEKLVQEVETEMKNKDYFDKFNSNAEDKKALYDMSEYFPTNNPFYASNPFDHQNNENRLNAVDEINLSDKQYKDSSKLMCDSKFLKQDSIGKTDILNMPQKTSLSNKNNFQLSSMDIFDYYDNNNINWRSQTSASLNNKYDTGNSTIDDGFLKNEVDMLSLQSPGFSKTLQTINLSDYDSFILNSFDAPQVKDACRNRGKIKSSFDGNNGHSKSYTVKSCDHSSFSTKDSNILNIPHEQNNNRTYNSVFTDLKTVVSEQKYDNKFKDDSYNKKLIPVHPNQNLTNNNPTTTQNESLFC